MMLQPASVGAAPPAQEASEKVVKAEPGQLGKAAPSGPSLASKLQNAAPGDSTGRDPFRRGEAKPSGEAIATPAADAITPAEFAGRYELQSVLKPSAGRGGKGVAVVARKQTPSGTRASGRAFSMGNQVGGWTLVSVDEKSATFEKDSARATLDLKATAKVDNRDATKRQPSN